MTAPTLTFVVAAVLLLSVPGPSVIYVITRGFSGGRAVGLLAALGNTIGVLLITGLIVLGLSALLQRFPAALTVLKWLGVIYLAFLGIKTLRSKTAMQLASSASSKQAGQVMLQGGITTVLNPKMLVIYPAMLPQFVDNARSDLTQQLLTLGLTFTALSLAVYVAYAVLAAMLGGILRQSPGVSTALRWLSGLTFLGLGARLAFDTQH